MAEEAKKETNDKKKATSPNKKEQEFYKEHEDVKTIMPTMIDDSEEKINKKADLSAIIPKGPSTPQENTSPNALQTSLISKENELKSDGSITIASLDDNYEIKSYQKEIAFPEPIDIEQRKIEYQKNKGRKFKKEKVKKNKKAIKFQNATAFFALLVIIGLAGFAYYYFNHKTANDFTVLTIDVELGDSLPLRKSSYVKPGVDEDVDDEMAYILDLTEVELDTVGTYTYYVTYNSIKKSGTINIVDTTGPELEVREQVTITEGQSYEAATFVKDCKDPSNCDFSFQDETTTSKYTSPGSYVVYIVATDAYNNSTTKQSRLIIEAQGDVKTYTKKFTYDFNLGYESTETYELHFREMSTYSLLLNGTHTTEMKYSDSETYKKARQTYNGEANYNCDDDLLTITKVETITQVAGKYSRLTDINNYLTDQGFKEQTSD